MLEPARITERTAPPTDVLRRVEADYGACVEGGSPFGVVTLEMFGAARMVASRPEVQPIVRRALLDLLRGSSRGRGLYAFPHGDGIVAALPGVATDEVEGLCREILEAGSALAVEGLCSSLGRRLCVGMAANQGGADLLFETLVLVAQRGASVAGNRGGGCFVHTKLYELMQGRAQRAAGGMRLEVESDFVIVPSVRAPQPAPSARPERAPEPVGEDGAQTRIRAELERAIMSEAEAESDIRELESRLQGIIEGMAAEAVAAARREYEERDRSRLAELDDLRANQKELDRLRRRIAKLTEALEETERRLAAAGEVEVETGVSSAYRSVQGLPTSERDYERKLELLHEIVQANLELRELIRNKRAAAPTRE